MKIHIGFDDGLGLIHSIVTTAANEHDIPQADKLLHGESDEYGVMRAIREVTGVMSMRLVRWIGLLLCIPARARSWPNQIRLRRQKRSMQTCVQKSSMNFLHQTCASLQQRSAARAGENR